MTAPSSDPETGTSGNDWQQNSLRSLRKTPWRIRVEEAQRFASASYAGSGTSEDPFLIDWLPDDAENPQTLSAVYRWSVTMLVAIATLAVGFCSSAYGGAAIGLITEFGCSHMVIILGITFFVLGFACGPLLWAPFSELIGRRPLFIITYAALVAFNAGCAAAPTMPALIVMRFFAGAFGSSPLTNAGGTIADMFMAEQRGLALCLFAAAPFMGPVIGPIVGGFTGELAGWRWVMWVMTIFTGAVLALGALFLPETYAPVLLRQRAAKLSLATGMVYRSRFDGKVSVPFKQQLKTSLVRPWVLLCKEPIVLLLSIYMAIIYGVLYMLFGAFPIVYQQKRGWSPGIGGLAFIGVAVGMIFAVVYTIIDNKRYVKISHENKGMAPAEARLPPAIAGAVAIPVALFWFAFTNGPDIHWAVSIAAGAPFGFGMVLVFLSVNNYLIDSYLIYAASVLAGSSVLRSVFGAVFPLFTSDMYSTLGIHWASALPGFLALACMPFPYVFWKYGEKLRKKCRYAKEAADFLAAMAQARAAAAKGGAGGGGAADNGAAAKKVQVLVKPADDDASSSSATTSQRDVAHSDLSEQGNVLVAKKDAKLDGDADSALTAVVNT